MTKYLVSGYIGFDNFGDEAIAKVLVSYLKSNDSNRITLLSSNPQKTKQVHGVEACHYLKFFKPILETDVLISGGGSLLQDVTSLRSLIYYLAVIMFALAMSKKVIIFAQGFTPFRTKIGKFLTSFVLKKCHKITVRDLKSQEILKDLGVTSEIIADPVFGMKIPINTEHKGVGIQLRSFPTISDEFLNNLADEISNRFSQEVINLFSLQDSLDLEIIHKFAKILETKGLKYNIFSNLDIDEAILKISKLEYLIAMRFHSALVGAKSGAKVLGINYDIKVANLAHYVGFPIVGLAQNNMKEEFDGFVNLDIRNYNIPKFEMISF